ncbi:zinc-dependent metalloprotease [Pedobacter ureilyticus]|uniref:Zinc-dependent metalloprotease n=1 Tax=Pedobacter ureilyticus TaxID=1393051 RepID=A0ABW9JB22_9SPHI|nr:zinc-dependent metalloprotease [Pedobacter helvus]
MRFNNRAIVLYGAMSILTVGSGCALFKKKKPAPAATVTVDPAKKTADSLKKASSLKPYSEIITKGTKTQVGYFTVHQKDKKYFFEVPDSIMGREILIVNRIAKASADMRNGNFGLAGDQIGEGVYRFEKGANDHLFLKRISFTEYAKDSTSAMAPSVVKNNVHAIAEAWPILAKRKDSSAVVVDVTEFLNADNEVTYFDRKNYKERAGMGAQQNNKSYVDYIHANKTNVEIRAVKTYTAGRNPTSNSYTVELNSSMVLLPKVPMRPRIADPRVGYFSRSFRDFDANDQGVETTTYATRWKLEPKPEDVEKYKRGELVEPAKRIIFYIDPVTPKKWVPYLIQGVNDWQKAFEAAGFKNAIEAIEAPTAAQDSTWSIDDASHSAIIYRPSAVTNAMGPSVTDPRSGEIIESHIFWYHNVMGLLQKWYMAQAAAVDPRARKPKFDDKLMGELIRFVSSHEVGHTLGLMHNFGSSSTVPVEKLRDKKWLEKNGHTPSIMDYARFNYVAQPEDNVGDKGMFPRIGDYDIWAIKWGYTWRPEFNSAEEESKVLVKMVSDSTQSNHRLWFGNEMEPFDPRSQNEDLGDDSMLASAYGIKNLKRMMPQIDQWMSTPGEDTKNLFKGYEAIWDQYTLYMGHVMKNVAGVYHNVKVNGEPGFVVKPVPFEKQQRAVKFLNDYLFATPTWLHNPKVADKLGVNFNSELYQIQENILYPMISRMKLSKLLDNETAGKGYGVTNLLDDLEKGILSEVYAGKNSDVNRRALQKMYINRLMMQAFHANDLIEIVPPGIYRFGLSDLKGMFQSRLRNYQLLFRNTLKKTGLKKETRWHLDQLDKMIEQKFVAERQGNLR